jgi:predicted site-specific integrase-resolvase
MKLSVWARQNGIHYLTAYRWFKSGKMPVPTVQTPSGAILVTPVVETPTLNSTMVYSRVSSHDKKQDLERQANRCIEFCAANGWVVHKVFKEVGSGMNDRRRKLLSILEQPPKRLVVEHKDRLTRFGFNYFEVLLPKLGCELVVINQDQEEKTDLLKDLVAVIASFCCRLYGLRRGRSVAKTCSVPLK